MKLLIKHVPEVCVNSKEGHEDVFWSLDNMKRIVTLFEGGSYIDFDDNYDFPMCIDYSKYDLAWDLCDAKIIAKYEDQMYYAGENFNTFKAWVENQNPVPLEVELE